MTVAHRSVRWLSRGVAATLLATAAGSVAAQSTLLERLRERITAEGLFSQAEAIVRYERPSGSAGENRAIDHIVETLRADGIPVQVHEMRAFTSNPVSAHVLAVESGFAPAAITAAFSGSVRDLEGRLVDVGTVGDLPAIDVATGDVLELRGGAELADLSGAVALVRGLPMPDAAWALQRLGATAAVFVNPEERLNELITTTVWGTPSQRSAARVPSLPVAQVRRSDGETLARHAEEAGTMRLSVTADTGWRILRLAVARIEPRPDAPYAMLGGHIDAWYHGATDEGASNAAMVEIARGLWAERASLRRGLLVAFWPGHSNGRYAGSAWFADTFFEELSSRAIAYLNVDGIGQIGAQNFSINATASLEALGRRAIAAVAGAEARVGSPGRNSDQSFNGIGLPLLQLNHTRSQEDGGYWWWHTPDDTLDKVDPAVLEIDTEAYAAALAELLTAPVLPLDPAAEVVALQGLITAAQGRAGGAFDLSMVVERLERLRQRMVELQRFLPRSSAAPNAGDRVLIEALRPLVRVVYTLGDPFHPDAAVDMERLPGLAPLQVLRAAPPESNAYGFALISLVRERNRLLAAVDEAAAIVERFRQSAVP